jgi:hypothetical protein
MDKWLTQQLVEATGELKAAVFRTVTTTDRDLSIARAAGRLEALANAFAKRADVRGVPGD